MADAEGGIQNLEFKSPEDGAWYRVSINYGNNREGQPEGRAYFDVHYESGPLRGQVYSVNLNDSNLIEQTRARFRCESIPFQDSQPGELPKGRIVCAAHRKDDDNNLPYFHATVRQVTSVSPDVSWLLPSKFLYEILPANDIRLLSPVSIEAHPVIQFLDGTLQETKQKASFDLNVPLHFEDD